MSFFFFSSRRRHTRYIGDWSSDVCSSDLALVSFAGPVSRNQGVLATTSLSTIRADVLGTANTTSTGTPWADASQKSGVLYVAVLTYYECTKHTEDNMAANGPALFYVHWIGHPSGVCNAAMALPS